MREPCGVGELIAERYRVVGVLGRGGSAITYDAERIADGKRVAVKNIALATLDDWKVLELFQREAKVLANLTHPGIPHYVEHFTLETKEGPTFYLVQELAPGRTLAQWMAEGWHPSEAEVKALALEVLEILRYVHARNPPVIHRDLKPQNVLREEGGKLWLVDFGAVRDTSVTQTGGSTMVGTYGYMAPEQLHGSAMPASDLFGLGSTILFLLTGRSPSELPHRELKIDFRSRVNVSSSFAAWLERMVEPAPERRFASAHLALVALRDGTLAVKARPSRLRLAVLVGLLGVLSVTAFPLMRALRVARGAGATVASGPSLPPRPVGARYTDTHYAFGVPAHLSAVDSLAFTSDSSGLLSASVDNTLKLWDARSGKPVRAFPGHTRRVGSVAVTPDGRSVVSGGDGTVKVWDLASAALLQTIPADASQVTSVAVSRDGTMIASAGFDGTAKTWSLPSGAPLKKFDHSSGHGRVLSVVFSPDGVTLATAGDDKTAKVWDVASGRLIRTLTGHTAALDVVAFAPDGQEIATGSDDHTVKIWRVASDQAMCTLAFHSDEVWTVAFSPDGGTLATAGKDSKLGLWTPLTCTLREQFDLGGKGALAVAFSPDGGRLALGHGDGTFRVWTLLSALHTTIPSFVADDSADKLPTAGPPEELLYRRALQLIVSAEGAGPELDEAEAKLKAALEKNPRYALAYSGLARVEFRRAYLRGDEYDPKGLAKALALADKALVLSPNLVVAMVRRARIYKAQKNLAQAVAIAGDAEKIDPNSVDLGLLLAELAVKSGDLTGAESRVRTVLAHTKDRHEGALAYDALEDVYRERADYGAVDLVFQKEIELEPESAWTKGNYAVFLIHRSEYDKAIEMAQAALRQLNYGAAHATLARAYCEKGNELLWDRNDPQGAKVAFDRAILTDPTYAEPHYGVGAYYQARGDGAHAKAAFKRVLELKPEHAAAKAALAAL